MITQVCRFLNGAACPPLLPDGFSCRAGTPRRRFRHPKLLHRPCIRGAHAQPAKHRPDIPGKLVVATGPSAQVRAVVNVVCRGQRQYIESLPQPPVPVSARWPDVDDRRAATVICIDQRPGIPVATSTKSTIICGSCSPGWASCATNAGRQSANSRSSRSRRPMALPEGTKLMLLAGRGRKGQHAGELSKSRPAKYGSVDGSLYDLDAATADWRSTD